MADDTYKIRFNAAELSLVAALVTEHQHEIELRPMVAGGFLLDLTSEQIECLVSLIEPHLAREDPHARTEKERQEWVLLTGIADRLISSRLA